MKRRKAIYWTDAAAWIAENDDPDCLDLNSIKELVSTAMVSDLTGVSIQQIANQVLFHRQFWKNTLPHQRLEV